MAKRKPIPPPPPPEPTLTIAQAEAASEYMRWHYFEQRMERKRLVRLGLSAGHPSADMKERSDYLDRKLRIAAGLDVDPLPDDEITDKPRRMFYAHHDYKRPTR